MSANNHRPHLLILPEDDANRQILVGFKNYYSVNSRQMQIEPVANGWLRARSMLTHHVQMMRTYPHRHFLLVVDFDDDPSRRQLITNSIPEDVRNRFYVIGCLNEPEALFSSLRIAPEALGNLLAAECSNGTNSAWNHRILEHNLNELERLMLQVRPFLISLS